MIKKSLCLLLVLLLCPLLSGCWNYRGINEMTIVAGVAVDKNPDNGNYQLCFEFIDISAPVKDKGASGKLIEAEGETIFDAVRNAKKRAGSKLYFGHTQVLIISQDLARSEDIGRILDWFLRDGECRETMYVAISQEKTAADLFQLEGIDQTVISIKLQKLLYGDSKVTASTEAVELYTTFETLNSQGRDLVLPAVHKVVNKNVPTCEVNGLAVFKGERLAGFLSPQETKYFLFVIDAIKGGLFPFSSVENERPDSTLEIHKSKTKLSLRKTEAGPRILVKSDTIAFLDEYMETRVDLKEPKVIELEAIASKELQSNIEGVIKKVQTDFGSDIFGFGNFIYKKDTDLWNQLHDGWEERFRYLDVAVEAEIHITGTASLNRS